MGVVADILFGRKRRPDTQIYGQIDRQRLPVHVAVIMDGNGRWAKKRGLPRSAGHRAGVERVRTIIRMSSDIGIRYLTLFAFSTENWKRPSDEVSTLMSLLVEYLVKELPELHEKNVRIRTLGDIGALPEKVKAEISRAVEKTSGNTGLTVNMAINYGARQELVEAVRQALKDGIKPEDVNEEWISSVLYTAGEPDPDLLIRTSGEARISNFLLYQLAYAELYFTGTYWPDFDETAYAAALADFAGRDRRFGGL